MHYEPDFVFHLYMSFSERDQAIGLEVVEALEKVNQKLGLNNFKAIVRLSRCEGRKEPRWTPDYIENQMTPLAGHIQRIWVCGPPMVNQIFDKTLEKIKDKL